MKFDTLLVTQPLIFFFTISSDKSTEISVRPQVYKLSGNYLVPGESSDVLCYLSAACFLNMVLKYTSGQFALKKTIQLSS